VYDVGLTYRAQKILSGYSLSLQKRIKDKLLLLGADPVPHGAKYLGRVEGNNTFRIRIGTHRALYTVIDSQNLILVTKIDKRYRIYDSN